MQSRRVGMWVIAGLALASATGVAQSSSASAARTLTGLMDREHLDAVAARLPGTEDTFVAALYYPGQQLLVISGRYPAPALLREKILLKRYRDAYQDLYGASTTQTRRLVEDLRADGLKATRAGSDPFDIYTRRSGSALQLDGNWKRQKMSEDEYVAEFRRIDAVYAQMLEALVAELSSGLDSSRPGSTEIPSSAGHPG